MSEPDLSEFDHLAELEELRRVNADLQRRLKRAKAKNEELVAATFDGAKAAMVALGPVKPVAAPKIPKVAGKPEVALLHMTDWQGHKVTATYDSNVMRERVMRYCEKVERITAIQRKDHPVRDCMVLFGGDLIEGLFNFPTQPFEVDATIFDQWARTSRLVIDVVRRLLGFYETLTVVGEWGNHGRIGDKRAAVPAADNLDRMIYHHAREMLADEKRLVWEDCPDHTQHFNVGNYLGLLMHGDEIGRYGYASPDTIVKHVVAWKAGADPVPFQDAYVGHLHLHQERPLPDGTGSVFFTGATESGNLYASVKMASFGLPTQRLHFIEPEDGEVAGQYKVRLR